MLPQLTTSVWPSLRGVIIGELSPVFSLFVDENTDELEGKHRKYFLNQEILQRVRNA